MILVFQTSPAASALAALLAASLMVSAGLARRRLEWRPRRALRLPRRRRRATGGMPRPRHHG